jgi:hypothetical protein
MRGVTLSTYIQHSAHIAPGREGLFNLVNSAPPTLKYEPGLAVAEGDYVIAHMRFSGHGLADVPRIAADIVRMKDGLVPRIGMCSETKQRARPPKALPMFGDKFIESAGRCSRAITPRERTRRVSNNRFTQILVNEDKSVLADR